MSNVWGTARSTVAIVWLVACWPLAVWTPGVQDAYGVDLQAAPLAPQTRLDSPALLLSDWQTPVDLSNQIAFNEGVLRLPPSAAWVTHRSSFSHFVLTIQFRLPDEDARLGVYVRGVVPHGRKDRDPQIGYELWLDNAAHGEGHLTVRNPNGQQNVPLWSDAVRQAFRTLDAWHTLKVVGQADILLFTIDGVDVLGATGALVADGRIGLRARRGPIEIREMMVQSLDWPPAAALEPGSGVEIPRPTHEVKPKYTRDAMRRKVHGEVWLECIVRPDGSMGPVLVVKSLDPQLDAEAVNAAKQWRFVPGTYLGKPVSVLVTISMSFTLR